MSADLLNAAFEAFGACFIMRHVLATRREGAVKGVDTPAVIFFTLWGFWNVIYYPVLGQYWSFAAGLLVLAANLVWIWHIRKYRRVIAFTQAP